jgi:nitrate/TMAO reductase-like tetraheme cytochrome c subunit
MTDQPRADGSASSSGPGPTPTPAAPAKSGLRRFVVRWLVRLGIAVVILLVLCSTLLVVAEQKTSSPQFCGSCHIMHDYYETWHKDVHGEKLGVACIDCHYAPGERSTIEAKMRGLSQVTSYFSGRYGTSRPRAHVDNRSCLTSKCHGDNRFMDKEISIGTVKFTHARHLREDEKKIEDNKRQLTDLTAQLRQRLGNERFDRIEEIAREAVPFQQRVDRLKNVVADWTEPVPTEQLAELSRLYHQEVRLAQLRDLQCTNCHSYVAPNPHDEQPRAGAKHFSMKTTACYTCHFHNQGFNMGTGNCLSCHTLPTKEITVHEKTPPGVGKKLESPELEKRSVGMNHAEILKQKVDCKACHADVMQGNATVRRRDCERCHDRPEYYKDWQEPLTLQLAEKYHGAHVPEQRAKCLDCHSEIHHQLVRGTTPAGTAQFLSSVMANCTQCHPNQHVEQLELLSGRGGIGVPKGDPNMMFGSRTNCLGCHTEMKTSAHGGLVRKGALSGCLACHREEKYAKTFDQWKQAVASDLADATEAYQRAKTRFEKAKDLDPETRRQAAELLKATEADLLLVKRGNGVHNVMYSLELLESVSKRSQKVMALLQAGGKKSP